ncbi:hypothetical protein E2562_008699 [Oryza meyeriana var. granulata]|uniref:Uncharacterized protein n=1 Tax=Oryza meyeriana var. granulata TaxID=110450 RepID=A0A6G1F5H3_9ORYZ|nr:hypothetical protein E2562_008699 [Oryza meyeriana var. granulata]
MTGVARDFGQCADVAAVLRQHCCICEQLQRINHRYCKFIVSCLLVTASQFSALLAATRPHVQVNIATSGELTVSTATTPHPNET